MRYGALEAGGTKMVCSIGNDSFHLLDRVSFPTQTPEETMPQIIDYFREGKIDALGIGSFGPLDLDPNSSAYGTITSTPKPGWRNYPILEVFRSALCVPCAIDTDVNAAALAEVRLGAAKGLKSCLYVTVGTGVGGGLVIGGELVHGLVHPEFGHLLLRPCADDPMPHGSCAFHDGCLEGLASGTAIKSRWGKAANELPPEHPAWTLECDYLAQMCMNAIVSFSPETILLGGGVMQQAHLFPRIREHTKELLNGYVSHERILMHMVEYITSPDLGQDSGVTGALLLAAQAL